MAYHVSEDRLDAAMRHLEEQGDTDILPPAFDIPAMRLSWDDLKSYLASEDLDTWRTRPLRRCLSPKQRLGLRVATQLDPLDTLLVTALVLEVGERLERVRLPADESIVHSYRFVPSLPHGRFYDGRYTFQSFRQWSVELAVLNDGYVLMTDISDFYPRLYLL